MRRIVMMVVVALVIAVMMLAMAIPVFAAPNCEGFKDGSTKELNGQHRAHNNAADRGDLEQDAKHSAKEGACLDDLPPGEGQ
jgi:hypothetical protein